MAVSLPEKKKKRRVHKDPVSPWLAIVILAVFSLAIVVYLLANHKRDAMPGQVTGGIPSASVFLENSGGEQEGVPDLLPFLSQDDFKNYLDAGRRAYAGGSFETEKAAMESVAAEAAKTKTAGKIIDTSDAQKFFSLGLKSESGGADIIDSNANRIYFSPQNQFYWPANAIATRPAGETKIFDIGDPAQTAQVGAIPQDGNFLIIDGALAVFLNNSLAVYDVSSGDSASETWRGRVNKGSQIIGSESLGDKFYLMVKTEIDLANPCPIKPLAIADKMAMVECSAIRHPETVIFADSVFTIFEINSRSGQISRDISFVGSADNFALSVSNGAVLAAWPQDSDHIAFFTDFLSAKCKGLLPNYILQRTVALPGCGISLAAKEFELRGLLSGWFATLDESEQARISGEIIDRLGDYLRDNSQDFEQTGIVKIDLKTFLVVAQAEVAGRLVGDGFISESLSGLRVLTVSGTATAQKMDWFVSGKIDLSENEKTQNNAYLLDGQLRRIASARSLDLPSGICAARFTDDNVYVRTCRPGDPFHILGFNAQAIGLRGRISSPDDSSYLCPLAGDNLLAISPNGRKTKLALFDAVLPARTEKISEYDLNDYWVDFEANRLAFAHDAQSNLVFLPFARGGHIISYKNSEIAFKKTLGDITASRAFFKDGNLYLAGDDGIEVFGGDDFAKLGSVKF